MPGQAVTLDSLGIPWKYDENLGALIAQREDLCDGKYMWDADGLCVVNPRPATQAQLDARLAESVAATAAFIEEQLQARGHVRCSPSPSSASSDVEEDGARGDAAGGDAAGGDAAGGDAGGSNAAPKPRRPAPRKPRARDDDGALARCTIERTARPNGQRSDMKIVTPDGRTFRSIVSALAHMTAHEL